MGEGEEVGNEDGARRRGRQGRQEPSLLRRERDEKDEEGVKRDPLLLPLDFRWIDGLGKCDCFKF